MSQSRFRTPRPSVTARLAALLGVSTAAALLVATQSGIGPGGPGIAGAPRADQASPGAVSRHHVAARQEPFVAAPTQPGTPLIPIPVVYYHFIRNCCSHPDPLGWQLSVTPQTFAAEMALLEYDHVHVMSADELAADLAANRHPIGRVAVLTFDDGFSSFATAAAPVLDRYGFPSIAFVVSGFVGKPGYMTAAQLLQVEAEGATIGAHTVHHLPLAMLPAQQALAEITQSRSQLAALIGHLPADFAYPYGSMSPAVAAMVQGAGFRDAFATTWGPVQSWSSRWWLHRVEMNGTQSVAAFAQVLGIPPPPARWSPLPPPAPLSAAPAQPGSPVVTLPDGEIRGAPF